MLSSEEKERLLIVPDDDVFLTRMCFLSEHDLALINKHRRPANRLGFAVLLCYLRGPGFPPDKSISPHDCVVFRLAAHLKVQSDLWAEYASREVTRWEHLASCAGRVGQCPEKKPSGGILGRWNNVIV